MVTNSSGWQADLAEAKDFVSSTAKDVGQAVGLVADDLIPGDAPATGEQAAHLTKLGGAFDRAGQAFKRIDTGGWHGQAADAAHEHLSTAPPKWLKAADAFNDAGTALAEYQRVLAESQARAAQAKAKLERAQQASQQAANAHNARVDAFNSSDRTGPRPPEFTDPAAADAADAQRAIDDAKAAVKQAGDRAAKAINTAAEAAPAEPGALTKLKETLVDNTQAAAKVTGDFVGGAVGSLMEMGQMARLLNPMDPYRLTHPAQTNEAMATMAMGVVGAAKDPYAAVKTVVDPDGWRQNPAKTMGSMVPDTLMSLAGGAGVASKVARGVGKLGKTGGTVGRHADDLAPSPHTPTTPSPQQAPTPHGTPQQVGTPWQHAEPGQSSMSPRHDMPQTHPDGRVGGQMEGSPQRHEAGTHDRAPTPGPDTRPGGHREAWKRDESFDPWEHDTPAPRHHETPEPARHAPELARHAPEPDSHGESSRPDEIPDHKPDDGHRPENPGPQREHHETPEPPRHAPEPDPHEPRHELGDEDRQTYRDRLEQRLGGNFDDHVARLRDEHPELAHLDDEKAMGLRRYIGEDANTLNRTLREGDSIDQNYMKPETNVLRSALDDMPRVDPAETPKAYRDIGVSNDALPGLLERYKPGATVEEPGFTSASKDIPPGMFSEHGTDKPNKVRFIIEEPRHARDLEATNPDEREVLWSDRNRFEVQQAKKVGDEMHIHMRDAGKGAKP